MVRGQRSSSSEPQLWVGKGRSCSVLALVMMVVTKAPVVVDDPVRSVAPSPKTDAIC